MMAHANGVYAIASKCEHSLCEAYAIGEDGYCEECKLALCRKHYDSEEHSCRYVYVDSERCGNDRLALRKDLNTEAIMARARELRPGHECTVTLPDEFVPDELTGCYNVHVPVTFDDGVEWLVRLTGYPIGPVPASWQFKNAESQAFVHELLGGIEDYPIAKIHDWGTGRFSLTNDPHCVYLIYDRMPGTNCQEEPGNLLDMAKTDNECLRAFINQYVAASIKLSALTFDAIGNLDKDREGKFIAGPAVDSPWYDETGNVVFGGPFRSLKDKYLFELDGRLKAIRAGRMHRASPLLHYLIFLDLHRSVSLNPELAKEESQFYLAHADTTPQNYLATSDKLTAIVDWEWARTTTKADAFACPIWASWVNPEVAPGMLAEAYTEAGRPDLAKCVDDTHWSGAIDAVLEFPNPCDLPEQWILQKLIAVFIGLKVQGIESDVIPSTLREWGQRALERYASDPYLADVIKLDRHLQDIRKPAPGAVPKEYTRRPKQWHYEDFVSSSQSAML